MKHYNLIVAGGGLSGVAAAVSAARDGLSVLLIEKSGCLGGAISNNLVYPFTKYWTRNPVDNSKEYLSKAEILARKQVRETVRFLKQNSKAFENSTLISVATEIGVRESRKLKGMHILTVDELKNLTDFEDSIALGNYDIDIHNPAGEGTSHYYFKKGDYYKIPYRCLLPKEYDNLLVAGRCISTTHEAQASIRIMAICTCLGEAAGTAAALCFKSGTNAHKVNIKQLQNKLLENGAVL